MADFPALPLWTDAYLADTRHEGLAKVRAAEQIVGCSAELGPLSTCAVMPLGRNRPT